MHGFFGLFAMRLMANRLGIEEDLDLVDAMIANSRSHVNSSRFHQVRSLATQLE